MQGMTAASTTLRHAPWTDRKGQLSPLRLAVFVGLLVPAAVIFADLLFGPMRPEPFEYALHESGKWVVRFLLLSLAVTPFRRILAWNRLIGVRRMIGVSVLCYALLHLGFYAAQENWHLGKVASEIVLRIYLTIGFAALLGLIALGATSFDAAIRKMGRNWNLLHRLAYVIGVLALIHFFLQAKSDVTEPTLMAGLFILLMSYRVAGIIKLDISRSRVLGLCATVSAALTAGVEYAWYALATGIPPKLVFLANFDVETAIRPAVWVAIIGLAIAVLPLLRLLLTGIAQLRPAKV